MESNQGILDALQNWYQLQCNGEWEHSFGISIQSLDNPGWNISIDLEGTPLESKSFAEFKDKYEHEKDWIVCTKKGSKFEAACGPLSLGKAIQIFLDWAN